MDAVDNSSNVPRKKRGSGRTGPVTAQGRKASSRNALKHGLDIELGRLAAYAGPAAELAALLVRDGASLEKAQPLAEALLDVVRIRAARHAAVAAAIANLEDVVPSPAFDRYERRALSRRRRLMRALG